MDKDKNKKISKINEFNILGINIQIIVTIVVVVFAILSLFVSDNFLPILELFIGLDLMIMAYNNKKIYQRGKVTYIYLIVGILLIVYAILSLVGVF